jgi:hypothetical protein
MPMVVAVKTQEATEADSQSRATPAFAVLEPVQNSTQRTEAGQDSSHWPAGIDYGRYSVPKAPPLEDSSDRLEILELLDD